jgi:hypothetical protein
MWRLPKAEAITFLPTAMGLRHEAEAFLRAVRCGYAGEQAPDQFIAIIAQGVAFRAAAAVWHSSREPER